MTVEQGVKMVISAGIITPTTAEGYDALQKEQKKQDRENVIVPKVTSKDVKEAKAITAKRIASEKAAEKKIKAKTAKKPSKASKK